jgi:prophage antirepressor-like protein
MTLPVSVFGFQGSDIRTFGTWDSPLFVAKDVCDILGITKYRDAMARLEDYEKGRPVKVDTLGGSQSVATITEAGLYALINRSNKPIAKAFKKWVNTEVLPSIRKTGSYSVATPRDDLRLSSTEVRKATMDALHAAGFTESRHYINVTTAAYMGLFGMSAKSLRKDRGLPDGCNVRDHLTEEELAALRLIEINLKETLRVIEFTRSSDVNRHIKSVAASIRASLAAGAVRGQLPG